MPRQTNVQVPESIMYGSAILEVQPADATDAWINVGAIRGLSVTENAEAVQLSGDNADVVKYIPTHSMSISFTQLEIARNDVREIMRGNFDDYEAIPPDSWTIYTGGRRTLPEFQVRITNTDENDRVVMFTAYRVSLDQGYNLTFQDDAAEDPIVINEVAMTAITDPDRPTGRQLYELSYVAGPT